MMTCEIKINNLIELSHLSSAYVKGELKLNISKLARELECDRKTVKNYLKGHTPKKTRNRTKYLDSYKELILQYLNDSHRHFDYIDHLYYFMQREHSITCTHTTFYRYIRKNEDIYKLFKNNKSTKFTQRFETAVGEQVQFDMKEKVKLIDKNGNETTVYIPTLTLSWSRYNYRKLILNPTTENLLCFLAQAFEDMGGVPKEIIIDNLKAFVDKPRSSADDEAILNSQFEEFCKNYNIKVKPCMPYRPHTKEKIETQNKIVEQLKNYNGYYEGLESMHDKLELITNEDNNRISQATRLPRIFLYQKEKDELLSLPNQEIRKKYHLSLKEVYVTNESCIQYKYNKYSLPKNYIGKRVGLAVQNDKLLIYYNGKIIEKHVITDKKLNIKEEHQLYYTDNITTKHEKNNHSVIKEELENIIYDNDK